MNAMRFRAKYVSASESGDYYQVAFENTDPAGDTADVDGLDSPYLLICETPDVLRDLDSWIRRRLRSVLWKQWKVYNRRRAELIKRGVRPDLAHTTAWNSKGLWNVCHTPGVRIALPNSFFDSIGLPKLARLQYLTVPNRRIWTRMHGSVGGSREASSYPELGKKFFIVGPLGFILAS